MTEPLRSLLSSTPAPRHRKGGGGRRRPQAAGQRALRLVPAASLPDDGTLGLTVGAVVEGTVLEALPGGSEIELGDGVRGWLVHRKRMGPVQVGDTVLVEVAAVDAARRRVEINLPPRTRSTGACSPSPETSVGSPPTQSPEVGQPGPAARPRSAVQTTSAPLPGDPAVQHRLTGLEQDLEAARTQIRALRRQVAAAERHAAAAATELQRARERSLRATKAWRSERDRRMCAETRLHGRDEQLAPAEQFRHEVEIAAQRLSLSSTSTLTRFCVGARFLSSLDDVEGIDRTKVVETVARLVSGRRDVLTALEPHPLRSSKAPDSAGRVRADGARAFRANLQQGCAAARRLHYWVLPDKGIELANVAYHDDTAIS